MNPTSQNGAENKDPTIKSRLPVWSRRFLLYREGRSQKGNLRFVRQSRMLEKMLKGRK